MVLELITHFAVAGQAGIIAAAALGNRIANSDKEQQNPEPGHFVDEVSILTMANLLKEI